MVNQNDWYIHILNKNVQQNAMTDIFHANYTAQKEKSTVCCRKEAYIYFEYNLCTAEVLLCNSVTTILQCPS